MVSLWGPISNLIAAAVLAIPIRLGISGVYTEALIGIITLQLVLAVFNCIPVFPLDGSHVLSALLPVDKARRLDVVYHQYGVMIVIGVMMFAGPYIWFAVEGLRLLLTGLG